MGLRRSAAATLAIAFVLCAFATGIYVGRDSVIPAGIQNAASVTKSHPHPTARPRPPAHTTCAGTNNYLPSADAKHAIEGFADRTSVVSGSRFALYVSTIGSGYRIRAFRMGAYPNGRACEVWLSIPQPGVLQPAFVVQYPRRTVVAPWVHPVSISTAGWTAGDYLLRLESSSGAKSLVPITVRAVEPPAHPVVFLNAVTTWQAYNRWGGYNLYAGPDGRPRTRSRAASFDRPYDMAFGAGDFLGNELPALVLAESMHLPLEYMTDVDLHEHPELIQNAVAVISLGHDEYYSTVMRDALQHARDTGTNLAFLGANAIFRHIRFEPSTHGPDRVEVNYKDPSEDPLRFSDPGDVTANWPSGPVPRSENAITGAIYQCNPVTANWTVVDSTSWLLAGTGVHDGDVLPGLVGAEYDALINDPTTPHPIQVVLHAQLYCGSGFAQHADATYYTAPSGAGVFDASSSAWVCALNGYCGPTRGSAAADKVIRQITINVFTAFAKGPAGLVHPAVESPSH